MLVVLSGTSSSGKTTLAKAMQSTSKRPLLHIEADRFAPTLPPEHPAWHDTEFRSRAVIAMHEAIASLSRSGLDYIVDGSLPTEPDLRDRCLAILRGVPGTRVIAVRCSIDSLREREAGRDDRPKGWAEEQLSIVYDGVEFDATVDTTSNSAERLAEELLGALLPEGGSAAG
jgi:chloramphenicol 3-O phosphotransferase